MSRQGVLVVGEALCDLVPENADATGYAAMLGGSGFNTALALARCGTRVSYCAMLSTDAIGRRFRARLEKEGVELRFAGESAAPSGLAIIAPLRPDGVARYHFHLAGTALAEAPPPPDGFDGLAHLHVTSFGATTGASGAAALALMRRAGAAGLSLSYDLNVRPQALPPLDQARAAIEERVALCDLVKASVEDAGWLYEGGCDAALERWRDLGAPLRLLTNGEHGARLEWASGAAMVGLGRPAEVVDTIGAGDAFMAAFLGRCAFAGALGSSRLRDIDHELGEDALDDANAFAAETCAVRGCDPPRLRPSPHDE